MPTVTNVARVTTKDGAVWRTCAGCGMLAALAPETDRCDDCVSTPRPTGSRSERRVVELRSEHFAPDDLVAVHLAGCIFAAAIADISHHHMGDPGCWDCYGSIPDELARLRDALVGMQLGIRETRAELAVIERRARRRAVRKLRRTATVAPGSRFTVTGGQG